MEARSDLGRAVCARSMHRAGIGANRSPGKSLTLAGLTEYFHGFSDFCPDLDRHRRQSGPSLVLTGRRRSLGQIHREDGLTSYCIDGDLPTVGFGISLAI